MPPTRKGKPVADDDDDFMSSGVEQDSIHGSDIDNSDDESVPAQKNDSRIFDKDSDEEELERLVLGDTANFRDALFNGEGIDGNGGGLGAAGLRERGDGSDDDSDGADIDDAELFTFDIGCSKPSGGEEDDGDQQLQVTSAAGDISHGDPPAWEDSDDERFTISLAGATQLRKLRIGEAEDIVSGTEYIRRLRTQFLRLNPKPDWAREAEERPSKCRRRSSAAAASADSDDSERGSDSEEDEDHGDPGDIEGAEALPLDKFLRDARAVAGGNGDSKKTRKLRPEVIDIQRSRDIPDTHKEVVTSLSFHPEYPVLLSSSTSAIMNLHHIAPTAHPTPNPLLTSVQIKQVPVQHAEFLYPEGDRIFFAGRRRYIHSWELSTGTIQKTNKVHGHHLEQKTWERFKTSPCGRYLGLIASTRKGGGIVNILNVNTMQWISAARLDSRGGIIDFCWWSNGNGMTILGKGGQVGEFSMASRRFLGIWNDEGSNGASALALSGAGRGGSRGGATGPSILGGDRWVAVGSGSGIVNIYERENLIKASNSKTRNNKDDNNEEDDDDTVTLKDRPQPTRTFEQLTTPCTILTFSPDGQLLALASKHKKDALRLAHLPSCTVYRNWPTEQTPLGRISAVAFGRKSDMLAVGNDGGKIRLWEIRS